MNNPEIAKKVYEKYPISKDEKRGCQTEKAFRDAMRKDYAKKLYDESLTGKKEFE